MLKLYSVYWYGGIGEGHHETLIRAMTAKRASQLFRRWLKSQHKDVGEYEIERASMQAPGIAPEGVVDG